jgi:membrane protein YqaA with SNARE-associated domain
MPAFYLGKKGMDEVKRKYPNLGPERLDQITRLHQRWGAFILLLTALPVLGTVLPATAGATGTRLRYFLFWMLIAKLIRYWTIAFILFGGYSLITR